MRTLGRYPAIGAALAAALLGHLGRAEAGEPLVSPNGPTFSVAAMSGLGGPLSLLTAGGPGLGIGIGLAPGWAIGKLHLRLPLSASRYSGYSRFADSSGASGGGAIVGTSIVAAPTVEYALLERGGIEISAMAGVILGWFSLTEKVYPAPPSRYVTSGPQFGGLAGLSFRYHVTPTLAFGTAGGLQYYGARITSTNMPAGADAANGVGAFNFFGLVDVTFYFGKRATPADGRSGATERPEADAGARTTSDDAGDDDGEGDEDEDDGDEDGEDEDGEDE